MKLMINVIGIITVIVCTILGLFLIPFFSWLTGFERFLLFLFIVGCIGLFVTFVGFIRYKSKSCKKVNVLLVTLYASLSIIIPSTILSLTKYIDFWVEIDGSLTHGQSEIYSEYHTYYTKFGVRKFGYCAGEYCYGAKDTYGQRYYVVLEPGGYDSDAERHTVIYNLYDCDGNVVGHGNYSCRDRYRMYSVDILSGVLLEYGLFVESELSNNWDGA